MHSFTLPSLCYQISICIPGRYQSRPKKATRPFCELLVSLESSSNTLFHPIFALLPQIVQSGSLTSMMPPHFNDTRTVARRAFRILLGLLSYVSTSIQSGIRAHLRCWGLRELSNDTNNSHKMGELPFLVEIDIS